MKTTRLLAAALALVALTAAGCILTSAQILAHFDLPNPFTINSSGTPFQRVVVDLSTVDEYNDHKDELKGLTDCAILGKFTNLSGPAGEVEAWITPDVTNYTSVSQIKANAIRLWGPANIGAAGSPDAVRILGWDESAALIGSAGKNLLIAEVRGDGAFTLYVFGTAGTYEILVEEGILVLTIDAGL